MEHRVRLQIMSVLIANDSYDFNSLKEVLAITDGNLASHMKALEKEKYISVNKSFVDRKPSTKYKATERGRNAFKSRLNDLGIVIESEEAVNAAFKRFKTLADKKHYIYD